MTPAKQRYVMIRGQVYTWEEKAPYVSSGKSLLGAFEYDRENDRIRCHECGEWHTRLSAHVAFRHSELSTAGYKRKHGIVQNVGLTALRKRTQDIETAQARARLAPKMPPAHFGKRQRHPPNMETFRNERNICEAQCLFRLRNLVLEIGSVPLTHEIPVNLRKNLRHHYGTVTNALEILGLQAHRAVYTKDILIEALRDFYVLNRRLPLLKEWNGMGRLPCYGTYINRFGSLMAAYEAAGLGIIAKQQRADAWTAPPTIEGRQKMSQAQKAAWARRSPEEKAAFMSRLREARGAITAETREKISQAQKAAWARHSPEQRAARIQHWRAGLSRKYPHADIAHPISA